MRVLIAASIYPPDAGGPAVHAREQYEGWPKHGVETGLVALRHYRQWPVGVRHFLYFLRLLSKVYRYDMVYAHDSVGAGIPALIAAKLFGKKFVVRIGGDLAWERQAEEMDISMREWYEGGKYKVDRMYKLSRFLMHAADKVVVVSPLLKDTYTKYYQINPLRLEVIPNPLPEVSTETLIEKPVLIFASRLVGYKNLDFVIKVLAKVVPDHKELKFHIMGDGPEKDRLRKLVQELGLEDNVVLDDKAHQVEVIKETARSLFTIAPALTEFNPNYVLQGIALGKPFLISKEHGLPFEVPENLLFDSRNEQELEERILHLLDQRGYRQAKEWVANINFKMSWDDNLKANVELMKSLWTRS